MLVGAVNPMEGSLLILPGSGLVALGACLGRLDGRLIAYRIRALCAMVLTGSASQNRVESNLPGIVIAATGVLTIGGCINGLRKRICA